MNKISLVILLILIAAASTALTGCLSRHAYTTPDTSLTIEQQIHQDPNIPILMEMARETVRDSFFAGDVYPQVWIRDLNTFLDLSLKENDPTPIRDALLKFFHLQQPNGEIIDGYAYSRAKADPNDDIYYTTDAFPDLVGHKNTVETDQETSLIQAVMLYIRSTGDMAILSELIDGKSVLERMLFAVDYLRRERFSEEYGLITGATTSDWGDVQPEHYKGVDIDENTHWAIDIYDNAMLIIALNDLLTGLPSLENRKELSDFRNSLIENCRTHLWDAEAEKFRPHIYLEGSPFPADFNEDEIYYHGGTAVAALAGILTPEEVLASYHKMQANVKAAGADSIGLTIYPVYPDRFFKNPNMQAWSYQNGGDWTWFGARMVQALVRNGHIEEAWEALQPMIRRVLRNGGFYEWYTVKGRPHGSGTFRGSAGVLYSAILELEAWGNL